MTFAEALLTFAVFAAFVCVVVGVGDFLHRRRERAAHEETTPTGSRWDWEDPTWDTCWPS